MSKRSFGSQNSNGNRLYTKEEYDDAVAAAEKDVDIETSTEDTCTDDNLDSPYAGSEKSEPMHMGAATAMAIAIHNSPEGKFQ